jgi:hypothetical protein
MYTLLFIVNPCYNDPNWKIQFHSIQWQNHIGNEKGEEKEGMLGKN